MVANGTKGCHSIGPRSAVGSMASIGRKLLGLMYHVDHLWVWLSHVRSSRRYFHKFDEGCGCVRARIGKEMVEGWDVTREWHVPVLLQHVPRRTVGLTNCHSPERRRNFGYRATQGSSHLVSGLKSYLNGIAHCAVPKPHELRYAWLENLPQ